MLIHNVHFNTYPFLFHHHGNAKWSYHKNGLPLKQRFFNELSNRKSGTFIGRKERMTYPIPTVSEISNAINNKLTIFMLSNLRELGSTARCLDFYGIRYYIVGKNAPLIDGNTKIREIIKFIPTIKTEYVMLLDSDDIFITSDRFGELVENYEKEFNCKMLFQAEGWPFPRGNAEIDKFERSVSSDKNPYKHLNSGIWIANTKFLQGVYEELINIKPHVPGDQPTFKILYKNHYPDIQIDGECKYFQSLAWSPWFEERYPGVSKLEVEK